MSSSSLSPLRSLISGHLFLILIIGLFYRFGFYSASSYFRWGPPVSIFDTVIASRTVFYVLLALIFLHQLVSNWIFETVTPWIIHNIQSPAIKSPPYSAGVCLFIVNANALYNQLHMALVITGITSQVSFLFALIVADLLALTYVNWQYLSRKAPIEGDQEMV